LRAPLTTGDRGGLIGRRAEIGADAGRCDLHQLFARAARSSMRRRLYTAHLAAHPPVSLPASTHGGSSRCAMGRFTIGAPIFFNLPECDRLAPHNSAGGGGVARTNICGAPVRNCRRRAPRRGPRRTLIRPPLSGCFSCPILPGEGREFSPLRDGCGFVTRPSSGWPGL